MVNHRHVVAGLLICILVPIPVSADDQTHASGEQPATQDSNNNKDGATDKNGNRNKNAPEKADPERATAIKGEVDEFKKGLLPLLGSLLRGKGEEGSQEKIDQALKTLKELREKAKSIGDEELLQEINTFEKGIQAAQIANLAKIHISQIFGGSPKPKSEPEDPKINDTAKNTLNNLSDLLSGKSNAKSDKNGSGDQVASKEDGNQNDRDESGRSGISGVLSSIANAVASLGNSLSEFFKGFSENGDSNTSSSSARNAQKADQSDESNHGGNPDTPNHAVAAALGGPEAEKQARPPDADSHPTPAPSPNPQSSLIAESGPDQARNPANLGSGGPTDSIFPNSAPAIAGAIANSSPATFSSAGPSSARTSERFPPPNSRSLSGSVSLPPARESVPQEGPGLDESRGLPQPDPASIVSVPSSPAFRQEDEILTPNVWALAKDFGPERGAKGPEISTFSETNRLSLPNGAGDLPKFNADFFDRPPSPLIAAPLPIEVSKVEVPPAVESSAKPAEKSEMNASAWSNIRTFLSSISLYAPLSVDSAMESGSSTPEPAEITPKVSITPSVEVEKVFSQIPPSLEASPEIQTGRPTDTSKTRVADGIGQISSDAIAIEETPPETTRDASVGVSGVQIPRDSSVNSKPELGTLPGEKRQREWVKKDAYNVPIPLKESIPMEEDALLQDLRRAATAIPPPAAKGERDLASTVNDGKPNQSRDLINVLRDLDTAEAPKTDDHRTKAKKPQVMKTTANARPLSRESSAAITGFGNW